MNSSSAGPQLTPLGRVFVFLFIVGCIAGAVFLFMGRPAFWSGKTGALSVFNRKPQLEIGISCGSEKRGWLDWAIAEFAKTPEGRRVKINLFPRGSIEGAQLLLGGDPRINVWLPASAVYKDVFVREWQTKYQADPIIREEPLALTPMVFVIWDDRYQAFVEKYQKMSFDTVNQALQAKGGWDDIGHHPEWGNFKFGYANPSQSNSGLLMMTLAGYAYHHKTRNLTVKDVADPALQRSLDELRDGASGASDSAGNLMQEMILKGPSSYDAVFVYENLAIESLTNAEGRWGKLRVVYPEYNFWNDNPYYIINASWSTAEQREAADSFLNFLMTERVQKEALKHGFRPANPSVPMKSADSPFLQFGGNGVSVDLPRMCEQPKADVVSSLLGSWERAQGNR